MSDEVVSDGQLTDDKEGKGSPKGNGPGPGSGGNGNNTVTVTIDGVSKPIHRGSYTTAELKQALGLEPGRELNLIVDNVFQPVADGTRTTVREGMEFVSQQPGGGAS
jgi:hypothetical protein